MKTIDKKHILLTLVLFFSVLDVCISQVRYKKVNSNLIDSLFSTEIIQVEEIKALDQEQIRNKIKNVQKIIAESTKPLPFIFGVENEVNYNPKNSGNWKNIKDEKYWVLKIMSKEALSLNIIFDTLRIPKQGELYIYSKNKELLIGPIRSHDNPEGNYFGTDIIKGNQLTLVYSAPNSAPNPEINVRYVVHGFKEIKEEELISTTSTTTLDSCFKDVYCLSGWQDNSNSVARLIIGGGACSGTLVNNTSKDGTPYLLTAKHCVDNYPSPVDPDAIVFRFKYRKTSCGGTTTDTYYTMTGSSIKKIFSGADAALLELNNELPLIEDLYLSGWNRNSSLSGYFFNIGHPAAEVQQIARANHPTSLPTRSTSTNMWFPEFSYGGMAGGSSGSALFDENHLIVGGSATLITGNCPPFNAEFSKFYVIWDEFKQWLDPLNLNPTTFEGKYRCEQIDVINRTINNNETIKGCDVKVDNVTIQNNSNVVIDAENEVIIEKDFEVKVGSTLEIK
jgi:lysyl endopeptidase